MKAFDRRQPIAARPIHRFRLLGSAVALSCATFSGGLARGAEWAVDCDGSGTHTSIGAAVEESRDGDTIWVRPCSNAPFGYAEGIVLDGRIGLRLIATGRRLSERESTGSEGGSANAPTVVLGDGSGGSCITVDHGVDLVVEGFRLDGCDEHGILVLHSERTRLSDNRIVGTGAAGIRVRDSFGTELLDNRIRDGAGDGILLDDARHAYVVGNALVDNRGAGVRLDGGVDNVVSHNHEPTLEVGEPADGGATQVPGPVGLQGPVGIGDSPDRVPPGSGLYVSRFGPQGGSITVEGQLITTVLSGTPPLEVISTTRVDNLNADQLDGLDASAFSQMGAEIDGDEIADGTITDADVGPGAAIAGTKIAADFGTQEIVTSGRIRSTASTGTAPLSVDSTTTVENLSADLLDGFDAAAFSQLGELIDSDEIADGTISDADVSASAAIAGSKIDPSFGDQVISNDVTNLAPLSVASTVRVPNLNADLLDGSHASSFATSGHSHSEYSRTGHTHGVTSCAWKGCPNALNGQEADCVCDGSEYMVGIRYEDITGDGSDADKTKDIRCCTVK